MTKLVFFMLLSVSSAPSVQAGGAKDQRQDVADFCNQFIINDPDPAVRFDYYRDCYFYDLLRTGEGTV
jgi:hypothetical protein